MSFYDILQKLSWENIGDDLKKRTTHDVEFVLRKKGKKTLNDFLTLVSPAASPYLEEMAQLSHRLTLKRFGRTIQMYIPLYLSNECTNGCLYCGFSKANSIKRHTLSEKEIAEEAEAINGQGFEHLLLVSGESPRRVGMDYFKKAFDIVRPYFSHLSLEAQPLDQGDYESLISHGLNTVLIYQETYNQQTYPDYHPFGKKRDFRYRLETPDRLGNAGMYKIGIGSLLGLEDWRTEAFFVASHLAYLKKKYWRTRFSISFPRLRPASGGFKGKSPVTDRDLVQLICAYRIFDEDVELSLSTRESGAFRDHVLPLGITTVSAGSKTGPGGHASDEDGLEQFHVCDERSPEEVAKMVKAQGYEAVWKDWDSVLGN
ncbi:MAG: 2-iminoacetate synthase ThiH [Fibrobacteria bacterium]|nr:2-iminoacetate synthase ThiH [Fibrobacteria bacterium]